jgi:hypothetical protein
VPGLRRDLKAAEEKYATEEALARALEKEVARRLQELKDAGKRLEIVQTAKSGLERDLENRDKELSSARAYKDKLVVALQQVEALEKQLGDRKREVVEVTRSLETLQGEKKDLQTRVAQVQAAAENRFAGIALTGRRVVFLVDMSGSMELVDETTPAPYKWEGVRNTIVRLMRSMPDLEKYQVIVFAERPAFLFGDSGDWLDFDPRTSTDRVLKGLASIKPTGGTDMYAGLQTAFRLRAKGLDTIYLLSDGLPNLGEGLPVSSGRPLTDVERNDTLSKYIRKTLKSSWNRAGTGQPRVRINTIGFFYESPDVGAFLWALARENDGSFVGMSKP